MTWRSYTPIVGLLLALAALAIIVWNTPNVWLLPAILLVPALLILLAPYARRGASRIRQTYQRITDYPRLEREAEELAHDRDQLAQQLTAAKAAVRRAYAAGLVEGFSRAVGLARAPVTPMPTLTNFVTREGVTTVFATSPPGVTTDLTHARYTLAATPDQEPLAVLEITDTTAIGTLTMALIDEKRPEFWNDIRTRGPSNMRVPDGVTLIRYDPGRHHSTPEFQEAPDASSA